MTTGTLRKNIEIRLNKDLVKAIGLDNITPEHVRLIRTYAVEVAENKLTVAEALERVRAEG